MIKLPKRKTDGVVTVDKIRWLLFGPPKIGKSTLFSGFPDCLFLSTESNTAALSIFECRITSWQMYLNVAKTIAAGKHKFKTIAIDTVDNLFNMCNFYICKKLDISHVSDEGWAKGWDMLSKEFGRGLDILFNTDYGILLSSHTKVNELVTIKGKVTKITTSLSNNARQVVNPRVGIIGYMYSDYVMNKKTKKYQSIRVIAVNPTEFVEAGDSTGCLPNIFMSYKDPKKTYAAIKKYFQ